MDDDIELVIPTERDLSGTVFEDPAFFRIHPQLSHANVLLYFSASPFYEQFHNLNSLMRTNLISDPQAVSDYIQRTRGYYYQVVGAPLVDPQNPQQPIWLISKKFSFGREGDGEMKDIALYYIVGRQIFQAPLWKDLAGAKIWQAASSIQQILSEFYQQKESMKDVDREIVLADRPDEGQAQEPLRNSFATLEKQFSLIRPQNR